MYGPIDNAENKPNFLTTGCFNPRFSPILDDYYLRLNFSTFKIIFTFDFHALCSTLEFN